MDIKTQFNFEKVAFDKENIVAGVITLKAPKIDWQKKRAPICIIPVVDISGSMEGAKLEYAKQSVLKLIDHLQPGDYCGLVAFSGDVYPIQKPIEMTQAQKDILKAKVGDLRTVGSTNFSAGMLQALEWINSVDLSPGIIKRMIMFTDGQPTTGVAVSEEDILTLLGKTLGTATASAFGYGQGANQNLLTAFARLGKGNYAFIANPDDALGAFAKELGGLLSTYAQDIEIDIAAHNGHEITEIVSDVDVEEKEAGKRIVVKLSDILGEEERNIVFKMKLSAQKQALPRAMTTVDVKATFKRLDDKAKTTNDALESKGKIEFVKPGKEQTKPTELIDKLVATAELVQAQVEAEEHAKNGNWAAAQAVMRTQSMDFESRGLGAFDTASASIATNYMNYDQYERSSSSRNSTRSSLTRSAGSYSTDGHAMKIMSSVNAATGTAQSTSAQDSVTASFTAGSVAPPVPGDPMASLDVSKVIVASDIPGVEKGRKKSQKKESAKAGSTLSKSRSKRW